ncbi:MAG: MFS transporter [Lachnospiraceae bacterium]|nr:MFS transporter [Lachnospiraceae bacterium]
MKEITTKKIWLFAIGQLGWAMLSGLISNWLVYFYQPDAAAVADGQTVFIPQGLAVFGIATIIGAITAIARVFDAVTDPWIASLSDRCKSKNGRRIPFLKVASIPLALSTFLVFCSPVGETSWVNAAFLFVMLILYYISITTYCTPYNALIPELGHNQKQRLDISTIISFTFIAGTALAYVAPVLWGALTPALGRIPAMRLTFGILCAISLFCLFVPVFAIREKDYVVTKPAQDNAFSSLLAAYRNKDFRLFVCSDISYWIAITMFQTGLPFFVTSLLGLSESMTTIYFVGMTALSLVFYIPINKLAPKLGKRKIMLIGFVGFTVAYLFTGILGKITFLPETIQGGILALLASFPMAIFGILPQAVVADISQSDALATGTNREGMFYAARTFAFKLGQSVAMLLFTAIAAIGSSGAGYRISAIVSAAFCLLGGAMFFFYNEKKVTNGLH